MAVVKQFIKAESRTSKNTGKPYIVNIVVVEDGDKTEVVEVFGTVKVGDIGNLTFNQQYKKWEFSTGAQRPTGVTEKVYKADPESRTSIEKMKALAEAVAFSVSQKITSTDDVLVIASKFYAWIQNPTEQSEKLTVAPFGDFDPDQPPVSNYEDMR